MVLMILLVLSSLTSFSLARVVDFCVADLKYPVGPAEFPCKNPANVTVSDFVYSGMGVRRDISSNIFRYVGPFANDHTVPGLNGLGISWSGIEIGVGGLLPLHLHHANELFVVIEGTIISGFIASDNKTLHKGDIMVIPQSLLHFQLNVGETSSLAFSSFNSANPGFESPPILLGSSDLHTEIIQKITLMDAQKVKKLEHFPWH